MNHHNRDEKMAAFGRLLDIMDELREKCPWDSKQTFLSLRSNTIEETYEFCDALLEGDKNTIKKELGDLLLHIVFYAKIASEEGAFDIADVCNALCEKLIFRHPHIYGENSVSDSNQVEQAWEQIKLKEKDGNKTILGGVPKSLPALVKAHRIGDKARHAGFDWKQRQDVWHKVLEEISELRLEIEVLDQDKMEDEFGDLMFSMVNAARLYGIDPETALERTNQKFIRRFNYIEQASNELGTSLKSLSLEQMDVYWQEAKKSERG